MNSSLILRLGAGLCFVGHGILALTGKAKFILLLGTFGIELELALTLLKIIGMVDIAVGVLILFRPSPLVLKWAMAWTFLTILAWLLHGDSIMDLMRRAPYFATPFALLLLLREKSLPKKDLSSVLPESVSTETTDAIANLDLTKVCTKMMDARDGEGWSKKQCEEVAEEYRRYLHMNSLYPDETIVPNLAVDTMWHYHILDTMAYEKDCLAIFGHILHHYPYFGTEGKADKRNFVNSFERTKNLYQETYKTVMGGPDYLPSFQSTK